MGYPVHALTTNGTGTGSGAAFTIPALPSGYLDDDVICILFSNDGAGATLDLSAGSKTAGWATSSGTSGATPAGEANCVLAYIKASGVVAAPSFVCSNTGVIYSIFVLRDVDPSTQIDVASSNASGTKDWTAANSAAAATVGAASGTDSLAIYAWCVDAGQFLRTKLDDGVCIAKYVSTAGAVGHIVTYQQLSSTTVPAPTMYTTAATNGGNRWTVVFKNKSGGALAPQLRGGMTETDSGKLPNWYGDFGAQHNAVTWQAPSNFALRIPTTLGADNVSTNAPTVTNATLNAVPWGAASNIDNGTNANEITGGTHTITSENYAGKTLAFTWAIVGQNSTSSRINTDGALFGLSDGTNWSVWQLASKAKGWISGDANCAVIDLSTATPLYTSGTLDLTAVTRVAYLWHRASGSPTSDAFRVMNMSVIDQEVITGGGSAQPLSFYDYWFMAQSWSHFRLVPLSGSGQVLCKYSVQIGDGTNVTYFDSSAKSFETPQAYSLTSTINWQQDWNVGDSAITLNIKASTSDTINLAAGVAATATSQSITIDAASGVPSAYSFAQSFVGWTVTDSKGLSWNGATFKDGGTVTIAGGGDLTNCSITETTSTNAALTVTADGSVITGTTISGTGAAYALELGTSVTAITLTDCTITAGSTDKVHVLATTGTVTITISGSTSLIAADVTTEGATVSIAAPQPTLDATVLASSRVVLYNNTTDAELDNTAPAGTSWSKVITSGASANDSLTLHVFKEGYQEFSTTFLYTGDDATILVTQETDPNLTSLRTELSITDYTTITEFALDTTGSVEIDADDADGNSQKARVAIWYNGVLTTENGARYLRGAISILSTAAFRINVDVLDLLFENISATKGLNFTDTERRLYRSDGTPIWVAASAPGSIQNDYSGVPDTVETGVSGLTGSESAQLMGLPNATSIAAAVWAYVITGSTTAVQMMRGFAAVLLGKVSGAGTGTETFRDIADTTDVVVATVDSDGNRTAITRTLA